MKIVKVIGGLGNQMFQYALALGLKKKFPSERILLDLNHFKYYKAHNGFELERIFGLQYARASFFELIRVTNPYISYRINRLVKRLPTRSTVCKEADGFPIDTTVLVEKGNRYFDGFWQHEEYFAHAADEVRKAFVFPEANERNRALIERMEKSESISLHVRRGDFLSLDLFNGICTLDYYRRAIAYMRQSVGMGGRILFCIFSDDIEWCRSNLSAEFLGCDVEYVDWNSGTESFRDMQLMSHCRHNVIANSSFSWWGAWLNPNKGKIVVAPDRWLNYEGFNDPVVESWIRIKTKK